MNNDMLFTIIVVFIGVTITVGILGYGWYEAVDAAQSPSHDNNITNIKVQDQQKERKTSSTLQPSYVACSYTLEISKIKFFDRNINATQNGKVISREPIDQLEQRINDFLQDKEVISIAYSGADYDEYFGSVHVAVAYKEYACQ